MDDMIKLTNGKNVLKFEELWSKWLGVKYSVFVNSGSSACLLALASLDLAPGSEIITPALTFSTTLAPIIQLGYTPKFIDSELTSYVPSVEAICDAITSKTRSNVFKFIIKLNYNLQCI